MLPEGTYVGKIVEWDVGVTDVKGTPYFRLVARLTDREDDDGNLEPLDTTVRREATLWLNGNNVKSALSTLRCLGFKDKNLERLDPADPDAHDFAGTEVFLRCQHEEVENKDGVKKQYEKFWVERRKQKSTPEDRATALAAMKAALQEAQEAEEAQRQAQAEVEAAMAGAE